MSGVVDLSYEECLGHLKQEAVGRVAVYSDPYPLVFPVNYRLVEYPPDGGQPGQAWIAIRTRPKNVIDRAPLFISFEIDGIDDQRRVGWSVLATGTLHPVDSEASEFRARFDPNPWLGSDRDRWLVIQPTRITGRRLDPEQIEWAFSPGSYL